MNKTAREPYLILTYTDVCILCSFCKLAEQIGSCEEVYYKCKHPLDWVLEQERGAEIVEPGQDCWGFRFAYSREVCADMTGIWLQGKAVDMTMLTKRIIEKVS